MPSKVGFIRVKLLQCDMGRNVDTDDGKPFEPNVAVNVKKMEQTPGKGIILEQNKKTIYPEWGSCFDAHLYENRIIQLVVVHKKEQQVADVMIAAQELADKCYDGSPADVTLNLLPFGRIDLHIRYFSHTTDDELMCWYCGSH